MTRIGFYSVLALLFLSSFVLSAPQDFNDSTSEMESIGQDAKSSLQGITFPFVGEVEMENVYLRCGCGENFKTFRKLRKGEKLIIQGHKGSWLTAWPPERFTGYINRILVKEVEQGWLETTVEGRCLIRPLPTTKYSSLIFVEGKGSRMRYLSKEGEWYRVVVPEGVPAWVSVKYVGSRGSVDDFRDEFSRLSKDKEDAFAAEGEKWRKTAEKARLAEGVKKEAKAKESAEGDLKKKDLVGRDWPAEFAKAEGTFHKERVKKNPEFNNLANLYQEISAGTKDENLRNQANQRLKQIRLVLGKKGQVKGPVQVPDLDKKEAEVDKEFDLKKQALLDKHLKEQQRIRRSKDTYIGVIQRDWQLRSSTPYVLRKGGVLQYYLKSDRYDLTDYLNKEVAVKGAKIEPLDMDFSIIVVRKLEILTE